MGRATKAIYLQVDADVHKKLKIMAAEREIALRDFCVDILRDYAAKAPSR